MPVSAIHRRPDGTIQALDESGWYALQDGDTVDLGNGLVMQLMGPSQIGGGSFKVGALAVLAGFGALVIAGVMRWGTGS